MGEKNTSIIVFKQTEENAIKLTYNQLSKMPFIIYLASFAGLICMWFGYFMFQISLDLFDKLENFLKHYSERFVFIESFGEIILTKFPILIKLIRNRRYCIFIINFIMLLIQLIPIIENFSESKVITRIEIVEKIYLPFIRITFTSSKAVIK